MEIENKELQYVLLRSFIDGFLGKKIKPDKYTKEYDNKYYNPNYWRKKHKRKIHYLLEHFGFYRVGKTVYEGPNIMVDNKKNTIKIDVERLDWNVYAIADLIVMVYPFFNKPKDVLNIYNKPLS